MKIANINKRCLVDFQPKGIFLHDSMVNKCYTKLCYILTINKCFYGPYNGIELDHLVWSPLKLLKLFATNFEDGGVGVPLGISIDGFEICLEDIDCLISIHF